MKNLLIVNTADKTATLNGQPLHKCYSLSISVKPGQSKAIIEIYSDIEFTGEVETEFTE